MSYDHWKTTEPDWPDERDPCPECGELGDDFFPCSTSTCEAIVCPKCGPCCAPHAAKADEPRKPMTPESDRASFQRETEERRDRDEFRKMGGPL